MKRGLPSFQQTIDPAWLEGATSIHDDGWSLMCRFDVPPAEQGNPSVARVGFLLDEAPHDYLQPGARLRLFERGTSQVADVEILA